LRQLGFRYKYFNSLVYEKGELDLQQVAADPTLLTQAVAWVYDNWPEGAEFVWLLPLGLAKPTAECRVPLFGEEYRDKTVSEDDGTVERSKLQHGNGQAATVYHLLEEEICAKWGIRVRDTHWVAVLYPRE
jgi:hypothetical protein